MQDVWKVTFDKKKRGDIPNRVWNQDILEIKNSSLNEAKKIARDRDI